MRLFRIFAMLGFPISVILFFCSKETILIAFGSQWAGAIPVFRILSLSVGFQMIYSPQGAFFQSANAVKEMFYCGLVTAFCNVVAVIVGCLVCHDIIVLSWLIVLSYVIAFFVTYSVMVKRVFEGSFLTFLSVLTQPLILSIIISIPLVVLSLLLPDMNVFLSFLIKCAAAGLAILLYELKSKYISCLFK